MNRMKSCALTLTLALLTNTAGVSVQAAEPWLDGADEDTSALRAGLEEHSSFKDPWGAKLRGLRVQRPKEGITLYCAEVNAPNSYGALGGWEVLFARHDASDDTWIFLTSPYRTEEALFHAAQTGDPRKISNLQLIVTVRCEEALK